MIPLRRVEVFINTMVSAKSEYSLENGSMTTHSGVHPSSTNKTRLNVDSAGSLTCNK